MNPASQSRIDLAKLAALSGRSSRRPQAFSPNDALVQVSLPLVLILAIATRLMTIGQNLSAQDQGPTVLDLWKQQLILRIDCVMADWEKESGLPSYPAFDRVAWSDRWPNDAGFQQACRKGLELADLEGFKGQLYRQALHYRPAGAATNAAAGGPVLDLFDPLEGAPPPGAERLPPEFRIDRERRAYALQYIEERCRKWRGHLEELQWSLVDRVLAATPAQDALTDRRLAVQMANVAAALEQRGYPLLPGVLNEYGKKEDRN